VSESLQKKRRCLWLLFCLTLESIRLFQLQS